MKKLNLLDQSPSFKVNDTGTIIPFNAFENNQPFSVTADDATPVFRIKNEMGFLKSVNATVAVGGYIFQLNTKDLVGLVPGTYQVELAVTDSKTNEELIFPDNGFCSFNISKSALTVTGTQIPTMSLDSFKNELQQYTENQVNEAEQTIQNNFQSYVNNIQDSTVKQAQLAYNFTNNITLDALFGGNVTGVSAPIDFNHIPKGIYAGNGWSSGVSKVSDFPSFANNKFFLLEVFDVQGSFNLQRMSFQDGTTYEKTIDLSSFNAIQDWTKTSLDSINTTVSSLSDKVTSNTNSLGNINTTLANVINGYDLPAEVANKQVTDLNDLPIGIHAVNGWVSDTTNIPNYPNFAKSCWGVFVSLPFGQPGAKGSCQVYYGGSNIYIRFKKPGYNDFSAWNMLTTTPVSN